jgi:hypothetical protein
LFNAHSSKKKQRTEKLSCLIAVMHDVIKETPKHDEMVIPNDPRVGIGLNTVSEPRSI